MITPVFPREVRKYEAGAAIVAGKTDIEVYEKILSTADYLATEGPAYIVFYANPYCIRQSAGINGEVQRCRAGFTGKRL